jgi:4'-phosphopantetheinyl transferase
VALADTERAQLALLPIAERGDAVLRWWVRKEAVLKMTGHGLLIDPSLIVVSTPSEPPQLVAWHGPGRRPQVQLADLELDGAAAAVAARTRSMLRVHLARISLSQLAW